MSSADASPSRPAPGWTVAGVCDSFRMDEMSAVTIIVNDLARRLLRYVVVDENGCWTRPTSAALYPTTSIANYPYLVHRAAYELFVGPIPPGYVIDHLCRNPGCCNPTHLEPVTPRENIMRGTSPIGGLAGRTHCVNGHEFTAENTARDAKDRRVCRQCRLDRQRAARAARKANAARGRPAWREAEATTR